MDTPIVQEVLQYTLAFPRQQEHVWSQHFRSFYEYQHHMVKTIYEVNPSFLQKFCENDLYLYKKEVSDLIEFKKKCYQMQNAGKVFYCFFTINYDDTSSINIKKMHEIAERVCKLETVKKAIYVHEKHRKLEGIHHHTHFLITTDKYVHASKFVEPIWKMRTVKEFVAQKCFLDCKVAGSKKNPPAPYEVCTQYIHGEKLEEKLPYVLKDRAWRIQTGFEHIYTYTK